MATFSKIALIVMTFFWLTFCSEIPTIGHASSSAIGKMNLQVQPGPVEGPRIGPQS